MTHREKLEEEEIASGLTTKHIFRCRESGERKRVIEILLALGMNFWIPRVRTSECSHFKTWTIPGGLKFVAGKHRESYTFRDAEIGFRWVGYRWVGSIFKKWHFQISSNVWFQHFFYMFGQKCEKYEKNMFFSVLQRFYPIALTWWFWISKIQYFY